MMELKTFVSDVLSQICEGITEAQKKTQHSGAVISPRHQLDTQGNPVLCTDATKSDGAGMVRFDVALSVSTSKSTQAGSEPAFSMQVASYGISLKGKQETQQEGGEFSHISRVQFEIPVKWPETSGSTALTPLTPTQIKNHGPADPVGGY